MGGVAVRGGREGGTELMREGTYPPEDMGGAVGTTEVFWGPENMA